ncbi:MAG: hypothetical protein ACK4UP_01805 [Spirosomataceae bacterium]
MRRLLLMRFSLFAASCFELFFTSASLKKSLDKLVRFVSCLFLLRKGIK